LTWTVRYAFTGLLSVKKISASHGEELLANYLSLPEGQPDPASITVSIIVTTPRFT
jgi:hypothetical protein